MDQDIEDENKKNFMEEVTKSGGEDDFFKAIMERFDRSDLLRRSAHEEFMENRKEFERSFTSTGNTTTGERVDYDVIAALNIQDELGCGQRVQRNKKKTKKK